MCHRIYFRFCFFQYTQPSKQQFSGFLEYEDLSTVLLHQTNLPFDHKHSGRDKSGPYAEAFM